MQSEEQLERLRKIETRNRMSYEMSSPKTKESLRVSGLKVGDCIISSLENFILERGWGGRSREDQLKRYQIYLEKVRSKYVQRQ